MEKKLHIQFCCQSLFCRDIFVAHDCNAINFGVGRDDVGKLQFPKDQNENRQPP